MATFLSRLFSKKRTSSPQKPEESFPARFHRFKLFLGAHIEAYSEMMTFEERLAGDLPVGMPFLRLCTAKLTAAVMQCILQLNALGDERYARLNLPFSELRSKVLGIMGRGLHPVEGPLVVPFSEVEEGMAAFIAPPLLQPAAVRKKHPEFLPEGFVVTAAAWWRYCGNADMHDEIDRIMVISQDDPGSYNEAAAAIRDRMMRSFPLPADVEEAVRTELKKLQINLNDPGSSLLVRCLPLLPEQASLVMPEQVLCTPLTPENVIEAVRFAFTLTFRPRALLHRLKLGVRDRGMPFCLAVSLIPTIHARGSTHRRLDHSSSEELCLHLRRGFAVPESWSPDISVQGAVLPEALQETAEKKCRAALDCLADAPERGDRHEIYWALSESGDFYLLGAAALPDPSALPPVLPPEAGSPPPATMPCGFSTYPGAVRGRVRVVRNLADALRFPRGSILVVHQAAPRWCFLMEFAAGLVSADGTGNGLLARTARRCGKPAVLNCPDAVAMLRDGQEIILEALPEGPPRIHLLQAENVAENESREGELWNVQSDLGGITRALAPFIVSLSLPDAEDADFRAENCTTFHDILTYSHDHAVREMFHHATARKSSGTPAKQLIADVPKQFWVLDLGDGFYGPVNGPAVKLEEVASIPMRSLWEGFTAKPWDGPPQVNAKGLMSIFFEATANPNLEPAAQTARYTEKNLFLAARRFCSMRCRFGFHFLSLDCFLSERPRERFIIFQFKGGAADLNRRIRRVHFVAELLSQFDFAAEISGDTLTARLEEGDETTFLRALRIIGYLVMHTRQLDMIMNDEATLSARRVVMLDDMLSLAGRPPLVLAGFTPGE